MGLVFFFFRFEIETVKKMIIKIGAGSLGKKVDFFCKFNKYVKLHNP